MNSTCNATQLKTWKFAKRGEFTQKQTSSSRSICYVKKLVVKLKTNFREFNSRGREFFEIETEIGSDVTFVRALRTKIVRVVVWDGFRIAELAKEINAFPWNFARNFNVYLNNKITSIRYELDV